MKAKLKPLAAQVIVITGASSGIGLATAKAAAKQGAKVVLSSRNAAALAQIETDIRADGGEASHVVADVSKRADLEALAAAAIAAYGGFDTWVNNAGLSIYGRMRKISEEDHRQLFDVNFWGIVNGSLIAASHLKHNGGGAIVNLGSVVSDIGFPVQGMYSASKHAIKGFTDALRMELREEDTPVSVTLIKPAAINTPFPSHAKNYTGRKPNLPPPVYNPRDVADAILHAAAHGGRDYYIGGAGKLMSSANQATPGLVDWFGANMVTKQSTRDEPDDRPPEGNLYQPGDDGEIDGDSKSLVMRSAYTKLTTNPVLSGSLLAAAGLAAATFFSRKRS